MLACTSSRVCDSDPCVESDSRRRRVKIRVRVRLVCRVAELYYSIDSRQFTIPIKNVVVGTPHTHTNITFTPPEHRRRPCFSYARLRIIVFGENRV